MKKKRKGKRKKKSEEKTQKTSLQQSDLHLAN